MMKEKRPKLTIPKTMSEKLWDIVGYAIYILSILLLIYVWRDLPGEIPAHFNGAGEVDRWGSKWELLILPGVGLLMAIFLHVFEKYPEWHNYPKKFNASNAKSFYLASRKLLNQLKNVSLIVFAMILYNSVAIALKWNSGFGGVALYLLVIVYFIPIVNVLIKFRRIK